MNYSYLFDILIAVTLYSCGSNNAQQYTRSCIDKKIKEFKDQPVANPPISVFQYLYNNQLVHYISAPCCDIYTTLYDENCNIICSPSVGITGKGDGKCSDFFDKRTQGKFIWKDDRMPK